MSTRPERSTALLGAVACVSIGAVVGARHVLWLGLLLLVVALPLLAVGLRRHGVSGDGEGAGQRGWTPVLRAEPRVLWPLIMAVQGWLLVDYVRTKVDGSVTWVIVGLVIALVVGAMVGLRRDGPPVARLGLAAGLVLVAAIHVVFLGSSDVRIDVRVFQEVGVDTLLDGQDPYAPDTYPDIYDAQRSERFYGPGLSEDGMLQFGYPYMPLSLLLAVPFHVVLDVRFLHLVALLLTAAGLVRVGRGSRDAQRAAVLLLTSQLALRVVEGAWNDLLLAALVAGVAIAWQRRHDVVADVGLGLLLATKQTAAFLVPVYLLLAARRRDAALLRPLLPAGVAFAVVTLPFLVRSGGDMVFSTAVLQFLQPFRPDSVSLLFVAGDSPPEWAAVLAFVAAAAATAWAARRAQDSAAGLTGSFAMVLLSFLLLSKQAFGNYYAVVLACSAIAMASHGPAFAAVGRGPVPSRAAPGS